ncbi:MAG: M23 family metallopeptidase [Candidatus Aminicenantes bacterium]|nr:M23 family metallopeptidase [Candidatus Aminicenantes bacterium]
MKVHIKIRDKKDPSGLLFITILIAAMLIIFFILSFLPKDRSDSVSEQLVSDKPVIPVEPEYQKYILHIERGTTLTDLLSPFDFSPAEIYKLRQEVKPVYDLARIKAGHEFRVYTAADDRVVRLEYDIDVESFVRIEKKDDLYIAEIIKLAVELRTGLIWGIIEDNPISAVQKTGEKQLLAMKLSEIFAWDIDFHTDLRKGDTFKILFEKKFLDQKFKGYGHILAAEFMNQGKLFQAFRYTYPGTQKWDYFRFDGDSLKREFLKSPISFARITSRFSYSRYHPIRKVFRPHMGVDYAARVGTPVQTTADGTVIFTGRNGAAGRMIKIRHKNRYESMYLHLSQYAVKTNEKVRQGQVIGYVGNSGESTGPHLDYRIKKNGRYINPLSYRFKPVQPLNKKLIADFQNKAEYFRLCFDGPLILARSFFYHTSLVSRSEESVLAGSD